MKHHIKATSAAQAAQVTRRAKRPSRSASLSACARDVIAAFEKLKERKPIYRN